MASAESSEEDDQHIEDIPAFLPEGEACVGAGVGNAEEPPLETLLQDWEAEDDEEEEEEEWVHVRRRCRPITSDIPMPSRPPRPLGQDLGGGLGLSDMGADLGMGMDSAGLGLGGFGMPSRRTTASWWDSTSIRCSSAERQTRWRDAVLVILVVAGAWMAAGERRPSETSFVSLVDDRYRSGTQRGLAKPWWPIQTDKSLEGEVASIQYVNHTAFAVGKVFIKASYGAVGSAKQTSSVKVYEHRYVGMFGAWMPMPYLPQPGKKAGTYALGACVVGRCVCLPKTMIGALLTKKGRKGASSTPTNSTSSSDCWRFEGGKSAALNAMVLPNAGFFFLWQFHKYWPMLFNHATLSMSNLAKGRLWVLATAPVSHQSWGQIFHLGIVLANTVDSFDAADVSFLTFALLYWGGMWAAWAGKVLLWRWLLKGDTGAYYAQEMGSNGGLAAQLVFLAQARPAAKYQFSLYFIPVPVELSAWQSALANVALDFFGGQGEIPSKFFSHVASALWGFFIASCWMKHH